MNDPSTFIAKIFFCGTEENSLHSAFSSTKAAGVHDHHWMGSQLFRLNQSDTSVGVAQSKMVFGRLRGFHNYGHDYCARVETKTLSCPFQVKVPVVSKMIFRPAGPITKMNE